jgi:hypothetical protein
MGLASRRVDFGQGAPGVLREASREDVWEPRLKDRDKLVYERQMRDHLPCPADSRTAFLEATMTSPEDGTEGQKIRDEHLQKLRYG